MMQLDGALHVPAIDELVNLAIGIAGDVAEHGVTRRLLRQPVNRHHGEQLADGPAVGHRLEQREIAEEGIRQHAIQAGQVVRNFVGFLDQPPDLVADRKEQVLRHDALIEGEVAAAEQVGRHIERLLRIVVGLLDVPGGDLIEGQHQVMQRLLVVVGNHLGDVVIVPLLGNSEGSEDQDGVIGGDGPAAFRDDVRMRHGVFVAGRLDLVDDVAGIFLQRVVHAGFEVRLEPS